LAKNYGTNIIIIYNNKKEGWANKPPRAQFLFLLSLSPSNFSWGLNICYDEARIMMKPESAQVSGRGNLKSSSGQKRLGKKTLANEWQNV